MTLKRLLINEIFSSIQGESTFAGLPCTFVRLTGCALRCIYCDTSYAFKEGKRMEVEEVIKKVEECNNSLVLITGGEPLLQNSTFPLMEQLCDKGFDVLLETSGDRDISKCDSRIVRIIDIKTPGSGAFGSFLDSNFDYLSSKDEIKFVITNKEDFDWAIQVVKEKKLCSLSGFVHFSPVMEQEPNSEITGSKQLSAKKLAQWILESGENVRLQLQMHKYIWDPITRGV